VKVTRSVTIQAPPETVWRNTVDVERWPEWSPNFERVKRVDEGRFDVGSKAEIKQPGLPEALWQVTSLTPGKAFTWQTRVRGITMIASHHIESTASGTRGILELELQGLIAWTLWPLLRRSIGSSLDRENAGLKSECERRDDK